jgi:hypothetical protein
VYFLTSFAEGGANISKLVVETGATLLYSPKGICVFNF